MPQLKNTNNKDWQYANNQDDFVQRRSAYKQQEWGKNCVMSAISKVLGQSTGVLAKAIVDSKRDVVLAHHVATRPLLGNGQIQLND